METTQTEKQLSTKNKPQGKRTWRPQTITTIKPELLEWINRQVAQGHYWHKTHAINYAIQQLKKASEATEEQGQDR